MNKWLRPNTPLAQESDSDVNWWRLGPFDVMVRKNAPAWWKEPRPGQHWFVSKKPWLFQQTEDLWFVGSRLPRNSMLTIYMRRTPRKVWTRPDGVKVAL